MVFDEAGRTTAVKTGALSRYDDLLARQRADVSDGQFSQARRLRWSTAQLASERERRLRELLAWSIERSPLHRERFRGVNPATFTLSDLPSLPVFTKGEMMDRFDDAVTEPALTLRLADDHLERLKVDTYLLDRYRVIASGGSSGRRGVFVYGWDEWVALVLMERRGAFRQAVPPGSRIASLFSDHPAHISGALHAFARDSAAPLHHLPMTMPIDLIVAQLNNIQPVLLQGYPTALNLLVAEARAGRLRISPDQIKSCGELLTAATRLAVRELWGAEIADSWGVSEGVYTSLCDDGALHLPDDLVIIEPVDEHGQPTAPGRRAAKIYLTNLYNFVQPLIRYEINDSMVVDTSPCACGSSHSRITEISGRLTDLFVYGNGSTLHPAALEGALFRDRRVIEYRIRQTPNGVDAVIRVDGQIDLDPIIAELDQTLCRIGLIDPDVAISVADRLDRIWSGKLSRFEALGTKDVPETTIRESG